MPCPFFEECLYKTAMRNVVEPDIFCIEPINRIKAEAQKKIDSYNEILNTIASKSDDEPDFLNKKFNLPEEKK